MKEGEVHIFICSPSPILAEGLFSILVKAGFDPVLLGSVEEISDYPQMLGAAVLILPAELCEADLKLPARGRHDDHNICLLPYSIHSGHAECVTLEDSVEIILAKLNTLIVSLRKSKVENHRHELSGRELEVLKRVALGFTNKEIGDQLFISAHTVISHRKNISEKTGIKTISGLTMLALLKKLIDINEIGQEHLK
jgi:DNA-binding CsgD family transcriptional regulator